MWMSLNDWVPSSVVAAPSVMLKSDVVQADVKILDAATEVFG